MKVRELNKYLKECNQDSEIIIFVETENNNYRPFYNISPRIYDKDSFNEKLHLDISVNTEYKSMHFPNNPSKEEVEDLIERKMMVLEELDEINNELKGFGKIKL